ncbi:hypothetical protein [Methanospirillum sp.]|uniref:hypothetical protein n=2 Tax=Methanospirillum sp. TaxID=45200 RepID=UPI002D1FBCE1|nr:hypothetical protein [Methanospirillum sp.]
MRPNGHGSGDMMHKRLTLYILAVFLIWYCLPAATTLADSVTGTDERFLTILAKTDRGYYAPGDIIRIQGTITGDENASVHAEIILSFQGMNTTTATNPDGSFTARVPISLIEPESMYRLMISAHAEGYAEKNVSLPIIIMGEPSSLAPPPVVPDEYVLI